MRKCYDHGRLTSFRTTILLLTTLSGGAVMLNDATAGSGILGQQAPAWNVNQWHQLPAGLTTYDIDNVRGKVIYLYGFQAWCPACNSHGFPLLKAIQDRYIDDQRVAVVAVQTVFEGYHANTFEKALAKARQFGIRVPVGHTAERPGPPAFMRNYRTGGTPWSIIIDQHGVVRYNNFSIRERDAFELIDALLANGETDG